MTSGPGVVTIGQPAVDTDKDWVALVVRSTFDHIGRIPY